MPGKQVRRTAFSAVLLVAAAALGASRDPTGDVPEVNVTWEALPRAGCVHATVPSQSEAPGEQQSSPLVKEEEKNEQREDEDGEEEEQGSLDVLEELAVLRREIDARTNPPGLKRGLAGLIAAVAVLAARNRFPRLFPRTASLFVALPAALFSAVFLSKYFSHGRRMRNPPKTFMDEIKARVPFSGYGQEKSNKKKKGKKASRKHERN
ncbi:unnamed protein product [Neospora caninum Liverpool]|uniref:Putative dense granule protein 3 n=2 Tax=Neospora caninum TaxID=29176 RepID=F0VLM7_NEOCL|nr:uncharacterized protein NCLIV_045870 [Neospora caninum Liverpool]AAO16598.1 putative dense granule protein 3 [Neospora caninum]CBZ54155.1 unnamed protein product [Neospora caninum Liverpool]CEL68855.1 TPA: Putative dense granule protein 3 [Neospora caninum Liverpool]|eukprot:XP_003884186.1 uncharacterized protein NCLIV_045870 [Neospora caninum Liverpool]